MALSSGKLHYYNNFVLNGLTDGVFLYLYQFFIHRKEKQMHFLFGAGERVS